MRFDTHHKQQPVISSKGPVKPHPGKNKLRKVIFMVNKKGLLLRSSNTYALFWKNILLNISAVVLPLEAKKRSSKDSQNLN